LFKYGFNQKRPKSEKHIVTGNIVVIKDGLTTESITKCKEKMRSCHDKIFVEEIENQFSISQITQSPMVHKKSP